MRHLVVLVFLSVAVGSSAFACGGANPSVPDLGNEALPPEAGASSDASAGASSMDANDASDAREPDGPKDSGVVGSEAGSGACLVGTPPTFRTEGSSLVLEDGTEVRDLSAEVAPFGVLRVRVYSGTPGGFAPGSISLACAPGTPCVGLLLSGKTVSYGASAGTLTVATLAAANSNEMTGSISGLALRQLKEVPVDGGFALELDPTGSCVTFPAFTFDTTAPLGTACTRHDQCGVTKVCDVASQSCAQANCDGTVGACGAGRTCAFTTSGAGDCATSCDLFTPCPTGYECGSAGTCKHTGMSAAGGTCDPLEDVATGCQASLYCGSNGVGSACTPTCNPFAASPGCAAGQRCRNAGPAAFCGAPIGASYVSTALIDQSCTLPGAAPTAPCGDDGMAYRGVCINEGMFGGVSRMCRRACDPKGPSCPGSQTCQPVFPPSYGIANVCR
jgi:hypothetical protein